MKIILSGLLAATIALSLPVRALTPSDYFGSAVAIAPGNKTIVIDGGTRYVNVNFRDTVTFVFNGRTVAWHFDGISASVPLSKILALDPGQTGIVVYIASTGDL